MKAGIPLKTLRKIGYTSDISRSLAINIISRHCKHESQEQLQHILQQVMAAPEDWKDDAVWAPLAAHFLPDEVAPVFTAYALRAAQDAAPCKVYGGQQIDQSAQQQMGVALQLPVALQGALMPDAHGGYGLPIGGVLATDNAVIPYAVGVDIGCRMALTIFSENDKYLVRYGHQLKTALREHTHFGMEGSLGVRQEHAVMDDPMFKNTELLRSLQGKAYRQLGSSGGGNHFVEFGALELYEGNEMALPAGHYTALLSHSGSRGLGAAIAMYYTDIARDLCRLPKAAQHLAWLDMNSEAGQAYWESMTLAGQYAKACHERIHLNLTRALGLQPLATVENHHNFAWKETLSNGQAAIVHRKGATPAHAGEAGIIPGSMIDPGFLVRGKGVAQALQSASHGAGRAMSRQRAKDSITVSSLKKLLAQHEVTLIGGSTEEAPLAYKDIHTVMDLQSALVAVEGRFLPKIVRMHKE
ncbi:tRNA-splicing ligase RtcB [Chitinophaga costaii]|uniref:3'-phosphate/5'-hydroxy nucleic acid ligase n=1 Tax=Chitinophaga costaii TaxID=1335309 RepID=A0A1C4F011_9BACT|nr:RtcB family protein [Chitinophaga costaii]PUZ21519.1 RtcB family protein [Chitinophaga costaii]SCC49005.1 tRNA-splicing ligase RtcB [Chitinophaga costaii]